MVMNNKKVDLQELLWRRLWYPIGLRFRKKRFVDFEQFYLNKVLAGGYTKNNYFGSRRDFFILEIYEF